MFQRLTREAPADHVAPCNREAAIGRSERADGNAFACKPACPPAIGAELRPASAAKREDCRIGTHANIRCFRTAKEQGARFVPAAPFMTQMELHAVFAEPYEPGTQKRRSLHGFGKHAPARTDKGGL